MCGCSNTYAEIFKCKINIIEIGIIQFSLSCDIAHTCLIVDGGILFLSYFYFSNTIVALHIDNFCAMVVLVKSPPPGFTENLCTVIYFFTLFNIVDVTEMKFFLSIYLSIPWLGEVKDDVIGKA